MVASITSDEMLTRVKARAQMPTTDGRLTNAEIFALIDDAIISDAGLAVYNADDGRWVKTASNVTITASLANYRIPDRAFAGGVIEVLLVDSAGNATQLDYEDHQDLWQFGTQTGVPSAYTIMGDIITLIPTPSASGYSLRVRFIRRPSRLALVADCALLTAASSTTLTSTWPSAIPSGSVIDVIEGTPNCDSIEDDVTITISGGTATRSSGTFSTTGPSVPAAGDYACLAGKTCVVQVPDVAISFVADLGARDVCAALGDDAGAEKYAALAEQRRKRAIDAMSERSRVRQKVVPQHTPLRSGSFRQRRWWT